VTKLKWTTLVQHEPVRQRHPDDLHAAVFVPRGWNGRGSIITLVVPWCVVECYRPGHAPIFINDPPQNRDVGYWLEWVCYKAWRARAALIFSCETSTQAETIAAAAAEMLGARHERVGLERLYEGKTDRAGLN
jgi:hypothetical protein